MYINSKIKVQGTKMFKHEKKSTVVENQGKSLGLAQSIKILPARQETPVRFLGQEDPLEKE